MRVRLERTGGFANVRRTFNADDAVLPPQRAQELRRLLEAAEPEIETAGPSPRPRGADRFVYTVTIEREGTSRTVTLAEEEIPAALHALIDWLQNLPDG